MRKFEEITLRPASDGVAKPISSCSVQVLQALQRL